VIGKTPHRTLAAALLLAGVALAVRLLNAFRYPPDWGYDAPFNWRYIYRLAEDGALPHPAAGWSTADPPLFFGVAASLMKASDFNLVLVPLLNTALGLGIVALAVLLVRRVDPGHPRRALLAGGLLLYLPAHIYMSVMVSEEMMVAFFTSLSVFLLADTTRSSSGMRRAASAGAAAGLAILAKLTGVLAAATGAATFAVEAWQRREARRGVAGVAVLLAVAFAFGGWYFARNRMLYGYFQPFALPAHQAMFTMPPGDRGLLDFVRVPLSTLTDPQLLDPDLLHSVWGSTYATVWFDGHRYFLPRDSDAVRRLGSLTLLLALLPTAAFATGSWRGLQRLRRTADGPDTPLLLLTGLTIAGYAAYNWQNPWFTVVKGTSLLGLSLPFAYYASEALDGWTRPANRSARALWIALALLAIAVVASGTFDLVFEKNEVSGLPWQAPEAP